jgi:hypothetical protein
MSQIRRMGYLLIALIGAALITGMVWKPAPPPRFAGIAESAVPAVVDGYQGTDYTMPLVVRQALSSADIISRTYTLGSNSLDFVLIGGTDRTALHDPRSCLVGAGWKLEDDHTERLPGVGINARACQAVGLPGSPGYDIVYLYIVNGRAINQVTQIRAAMLWSALLGKKGTPVYFLRFLRPLTPDPSENRANHAALDLFAARMVQRLSPVLMRTTS